MSEARPEIRKAVETMLKKGKWTVPGTFMPYTEWNGTDADTRIHGEVWGLVDGVDVDALGNVIYRATKQCVLKTKASLLASIGFYWILQ